MDRSKWWFGAHVSAEGGPTKALERANGLGSSALALFVKSQRRWFAPALSEEKVQEFKKSCRAYGFSPERLLPHSGYLINLGSPDPKACLQSLESLCEEMRRCTELGLTQLNLHPGSSLGKLPLAVCLRQIADLLTQALERVPGITLLLENTAGQGSQVGYRFEQLSEILSHLPSSLNARSGVCLDTCHAFAAGYDLRQEETCLKTFEEFDRVVGMQRLKGMHLNDSKAGLGSRVDRHQCLGAGEIGWRAFTFIARDGRFSGIPLILETPEPDKWPQELSALRSLSAGCEG